MPEISVVVPTCNRAARLRQCLESLAGQTGCRFEVIVVDDGSRDETPQVVERFVEAHPDVGLVYLVNDRNQGANPSRNRAVRAARAALVAFTDDDCVAEPDWLAKLQAGFTGPDVAAVTGLVLSPPPENLYERTLLGLHRVSGGEAATRLVGGNMCVRRELLLAFMLDEDRAGPAPTADARPDLSVSGRGDEEGLYLLLKAAGYRQRVADSARVWHYHGYSRRTFFRQAWRGGRSAARLVYKFHLPPRIDMLPWILAYATLPLALAGPLPALVPAAMFAAALAAILYNDLFRKRKTSVDTLVTLPLLVAYYHVRLAGYLYESLRLRVTRHALTREYPGRRNRS
jgi:glycosyltransferase involved in cell wall biosynthesis